jgi:hypothetical protein
LESFAGASKKESWRAVSARVLRSHSLFIVLCLIYVVVGYFYVEAFQGQTRRLSYTSYFMLRMAVPILIIVLGVFVFWEAYRVRPDRLLHHCCTRIRLEILTKDRIAQAVPVLLILPIVFTTFTNIKHLIPTVNPFSWDAYFAELDRVIHFGQQPYEFLQPLLGFPIATQAIYATYLFWMLFFYVVLFWQTFSVSNPFLRMQFLLTFVLSWMLIGSIGATVLSSAGPVYFERVVGQPGDFAPLMDYLNAVFVGQDSSLISVQEKLWLGYVTSENQRFGGISAMPSMHVTIVAIIAFLGWGHSKIAGILFTTFAFLILVGSVHLAWHYAVDGYFGIVAAWLLWTAVGFALRRLSGILGLSQNDTGSGETAVAVA